MRYVCCIAERAGILGGTERPGPLFVLVAT